MMGRRHLVFALAIVLCAIVVNASYDHTYTYNEPVQVWMNQVSPLDNPSETYAYYDLPFPCQPEQKIGPGESLGELLEGDSFLLSPYQLRFGVDASDVSLCGQKTLTREQITVLRDAVLQFSTFSMVVDELPVIAFIGYSEAEVQPDGTDVVRHYLNTHLQFSLGVNEDQIVEVNVTATDLLDARVELSAEVESVPVDFTYSVTWINSTVDYAQRLGHQNDGLLNVFPIYDPSGPAQIRWFSILNAFTLILFLVVFIALILLRILRRDYVKLEKMQQSQDDVDDAEDDIGWKRIHTEVFRFPPNKSIFSALVGVGTQFICLIFSLVFLVVMGVFSNYHYGALASTAIVLYALTAVIAGYMSAAWFKHMDGERWLSNLLLTTMLYAVPFWVIGAFLNTVAISYHSTRALPFGTIVGIIAIWGAVAFPLTMVGGFLARRFSHPFHFPTQARMLPKKIPETGWFQSMPVQMAVAGFLPFTAIYLELYYIFSSVWGHRLYTLYGVLFLAFMVMVIVTACITICLVYFQLAAEDYRWWWRSLLCGGSTSAFVFVYSIYFYAQSQMSGFFQASFYFGGVLLAAYAIFIMLGAVGYFAAHIFVSRIYSVIKTQ